PNRQLGGGGGEEIVSAELVRDRRLGRIDAVARGAAEPLGVVALVVAGLVVRLGGVVVRVPGVPGEAPLRSQAIVEGDHAMTVAHSARGLGSVGARLAIVELIAGGRIETSASTG